MTEEKLMLEKGINFGDLGWSVDVWRLYKSIFDKIIEFLYSKSEYKSLHNCLWDDFDQIETLMKLYAKWIWIPRTIYL